MAIVRPAPPRARVTTSARGLEIAIPARRNIFLMAFMSLWLCGWLFGEVMVSRHLLVDGVPGQPRAFLVFWMAGWTMGGALCGYILLWQLAGVEQVVVGGGLISIQRALFGLGRRREYELIHVRNLRAAPVALNPFDPKAGLAFWGISGGAIAFDHGAATIRFGAGLPEGEAQSVVETIRAATGPPTS